MNARHGEPRGATGRSRGKALPKAGRGMVNSKGALREYAEKS
jgi:hypothetical protein